jgi:hypothetical protein
MTEMVLALPFLLFILVALLHFGRGATRVQRTDAAARYTSWRDAVHAPRPALDEAPDMRDWLLGGGVALKTDRGDALPRDTNRARVAAMPTADSAALADAVQQRFGHGRTAALTGSYPVDLALSARLARPIRRRHTRISGDWRYMEGWRSRGAPSRAWPSHGPWAYGGPRAAVLPLLGGVLWPEADRRLRAAGRSNDLAGLLSRFTRAPGGYQGPEVQIE